MQSNKAWTGRRLQQNSYTAMGAALKVMQQETRIQLFPNYTGLDYLKCVGF